MMQYICVHKKICFERSKFKKKKKKKYEYDFVTESINGQVTIQFDVQTGVQN